MGEACITVVAAIDPEIAAASNAFEQAAEILSNR
jgi:hypothetical protein